LAVALSGFLPFWQINIVVVVVNPYRKMLINKSYRDKILVKFWRKKENSNEKYIAFTF